MIELRRHMIATPQGDGILKGVHFDGNTYFNLTSSFEFDSHWTVYATFKELEISDIEAREDWTYIFGRCNSFGVRKNYIAVRLPYNMAAGTISIDDYNMKNQITTDISYQDIIGNTKNVTSFVDALNGTIMRNSPVILGAMYQHSVQAIVAPAIFNLHKCVLKDVIYSNTIQLLPYRKNGEIGLFCPEKNIFAIPTEGVLTEVK